MTAEEFPAMENALVETILRTGIRAFGGDAISAADLILAELHKYRDAVIDRAIAAARQAWEAERALLTRRIAQEHASFVTELGRKEDAEAERAALLRRIETLEADRRAVVNLAVRTKIGACDESG